MRVQEVFFYGALEKVLLRWEVWYGRNLRKTRAQGGQAALISVERETLQARLAALDRGRAGREQAHLTGDNTPTSDVLDSIQENMAKEEALVTRQALIQRLRVLAKAEEKVREGTYGLCEMCGEPIPPARLRALPEAILCVPCAEAEEHRPLRSR
jgi:RNA polymerase-binding transcription factor DksA